MALTTEQLEAIKTKIETDKVRPIRAIRELHPDGNFQEIRQQLFETYDRQELLSHLPEPTPAPELTKEEKIARVDQQLARIEQRKARLEQQKTDLQGE
jgi:hypothetical protein